MPGRTFEFDFESRYQPLALAFGASPRSANVTVRDDGVIFARFGFVSLETTISNIEAIERSGGYKWWKAIGVRMSVADRGLTFGSSTRRGVCVRFTTPVRPKPSLFGLAHPGLTLTLKDPDGFIAAIGAPDPQ